MLLRGYYAILDLRGPVPAATPQGPLLDALLVRAGTLLGGRPCMLQVRAKAWGAGALAVAARAIHPLAQAAGVPLCVNDRLDVALAVGAEAVHLGQDDLPLAEARTLAGTRLAVGISTHTQRQAEAALAGGADYIGFGPIFATGTKDNPDPVVGLPALRGVALTAAATGRSVPVVAIGGITLERAADVAAAGASAAALIHAIAAAADPAAAGRTVNAAFGVT